MLVSYLLPRRTIPLLDGVYATYWSQMAFNVGVIIVVLACGAIGVYRSGIHRFRLIEIASRLGRGCFQYAGEQLSRNHVGGSPIRFRDTRRFGSGLNQRELHAG